MSTLNKISLNGTTYDIGDAFRYSTMPTAGSSLEGKIVQYIGDSDGTYQQGSFYECTASTETSGAYVWAKVSDNGCIYSVDSATSATLTIFTPGEEDSSWSNTSPIGVAVNYVNKARADGITQLDITIYKVGDSYNTSCSFLVTRFRINPQAGAEINASDNKCLVISYNAHGTYSTHYATLQKCTSTLKVFYSSTTNKYVRIALNFSGASNFSHAYLAKDNTDSYTPTADYNPATKKYVDDNTLPYYDSGYYMTPTRWTIVSELPDYPASNTLYFVSPDYVEQYINTNVTSNGFNSGVTWSHITNLFMKTDDHTNIVETWQNTAPNSGSQSTSWQVHAPKYDVAVGATPNFTNTNSEDLYMHGVLEQRDPQTTALRYSAYLNVESNLASGTTYYFDSDDYDTPTVSGAIPIYIPGSTSFYYTIGTNGGLACLKGDTPIKTKGSKTKQIKNIEVGDVVTDAEGNGTEVIKIYKHTIPETYNITLSNGDTLVASPCHKFSIKGRYRYACQVVKDHKLDRGDGSTFDVTSTEVKQEEMEVYEILTKSGTYTLANGIICECEAI